jgi:hypothetical protein
MPDAAQKFVVYCFHINCCINNDEERVHVCVNIICRENMLCVAYEILVGIHVKGVFPPALGAISYYTRYLALGKFF